MVRIAAINGSPRKGNTESMLDVLLKGTGSEIINLRQKKIDFCGGGDEYCGKAGGCCIKDDMGKIYPILEQADLIILASPCYFSNVTAIMKAFMDRCNPYYFNRKLEGKRFFLMMVGGHEVSVKKGMVCMENFLKGIYGKKIGEFYAVAEQHLNKKIIKELENIRKKLIENG